MVQKISLNEEEGIIRITMDNGERPSVIDLAFCDGLLEALNHVEKNASCRAVILGATGKVFSAGGDLEQIWKEIEEPSRILSPLIDRFHQAILDIRRLPVPVIASVQGAAAGAGFSLTMACDIVVASDRARFVVGYPKIGASSDGGLSFQLAKRLGRGRALDVLLLNDSISALEARELGLVQRVVDPAKLEEEATFIARRIATLPRTAVKQFKILVGSAVDQDLAHHLDLEKEAFIKCSSSSDFRDRVLDFLAQGGKHAGNKNSN